jgi:hypothetical protein
MDWNDCSPTWGLRWGEGGYFYLHLMWQHWRTGHWTATRTVSRRYATLEMALKQFETIDGVIMIFPV